MMKEMMKEMMPTMIVMLIVIVAALFFVAQGVRMQNQVAGEEAAFHQLQSEYFSQSKAIRDGAETGSVLSKQLVQIKNFPSDLLRLKLVGVGKILTGIFIILFGILIALMIMPVRSSSNPAVSISTRLRAESGS